MQGQIQGQIKKLILKIEGKEANYCIHVCYLFARITCYYDTFSLKHTLMYYL